MNAGRTLVTATMSEVGRRSRNEDRFGTIATGVVYRWVVADGLGGHDSGDVAAEAAVDAALRAPAVSPLALVETVEAMIRQANEAVIVARARVAASTMGSTIALAVSDGMWVVWGHVGDTRIYRFRADAAEQLTRDHSVAESLHASAWDGNRKASPLLSSLGTTEMYYDVSAVEALQMGDVFLLASDGLWGAISMDGAAAALRAAPSLTAWLEGLHRDVERRADPAQDNYTAVAFGVAEETAKRP